MDIIEANLVAAIQAARDEISKILSTNATSAELNSITNPVNTQGKYTGKTVFNTTTVRLVTAIGALPEDAWVNASTGSVAHIPF